MQGSMPGAYLYSCGSKKKFKSPSMLTDFLKAHGRDTVVIVGSWTEACVRATAQGAAHNGFQPVVLTRATAGHWGVARVAYAVIDSLFGNVVHAVAFRT